MAERLSPGVFIEEAPSAPPTTTGVSTSTFALVGYTAKGPTDRALLVGSYPDFEAKFGGLTRLSRVPLAIDGYFRNGGRRAYVVRVVPADAVAADAQLWSAISDQQIEFGNGVVTAFSKDTTVVPTALRVNAGLSPIVPSTATIRWRSATAPVAAEQAKQRDGVTNLAADGVLVTFEGRINPTSLGALLDANGLPVDPEMDLITGDVTISSGAQTVTIPGATGGPIATVTSGGNTALIDRRTGRFTVTFAAAPVAGAVNIVFTPTTVTRTATLSGFGSVCNVTGAQIDGAYATTVNGVAPNTLNVETGAYNFKATVAPHNGCRILIDYTIRAWNLDPVSIGSSGNDLRVSVRGDSTSYDTVTGMFGRVNVTVETRTASGIYEAKETYEGLSLTDADDAQYAPDVLNALSDLVRVQTPGSDETLEQLHAHKTVQMVAGGTATSANRTVTGALKLAPVQGRMVKITYVRDSDGATRTITDNGSGILTGAVDPTYTSPATVLGVTVQANRIDYVSGVFNFRTLEAIRANTPVLVEFGRRPTATVHREVFGDLDKGYTVGSDGTFDSVNFGKDRFTTATTLQTDGRGLYALDRVESIMQVAIPDWAGDSAVAQDLVSWAEQRALQPRGGDRFVILTTPQGSSAQDAVDYVRFELGITSKYAAIYWPWLKLRDPLRGNRSVVFPPEAHVAGVFARVDNTRNVAKAPAGQVDGALLGIVALEIDRDGLGPDQTERDLVYPVGINPLRADSTVGRCVYGARTLDRGEWRQINAVRLFQFVEQSVYASTQWTVFETRGPALNARIQLQLDSFLKNLFDQGYFAGKTPESSYAVSITDSDPDSTETLTEVQMAPGKPNEFSRFRFRLQSAT